MQSFLRRRISREIFFVVFLAAAIFTPVHGVAAAPLDIFVSPISGDDANLGITENQPIKTLAHAQELVRAENQTQTGDIHVYLCGGTYVLPQTLQLTAADSGMNGYRVIYENSPASPPLCPGGSPIISGGYSVNSVWQKDGNTKIWKTHLDSANPIRQLYVNGQRAIRARTNAAQEKDFFIQKSLDGSVYNVYSPNMSNWENIPQIEFVANNHFKQFHCPVKEIDGSTIVMQQPCWKNSQYGESPHMDSPTWIENAFELLDTPGEWYFNQTTQYLYYYPYAGENIAAANVVVPKLETLIEADGPIHDIQFHGLTFSYATWNQPSTNEGYVPMQSGIIYHDIPDGMLVKSPANITLHAAHDIVFDGNVFTHLGASGLSFDQGSANNTITGNHFIDISGSAMQIGDDPYAVTGVSAGNTIENNYIQGVAAEYQDQDGIWLGSVKDTIVTHNELTNLPYTGISIGWGWAGATTGENNTLSNNYIHNHMRALNDGGGIYTLADQPGSVISENYIQDQVNALGLIYLDTASQHFTVTRNVLLNNPLYSVYIKGWDNTVTDNWLVGSPYEDSSIGNVVGHNQIQPNSLISIEAIPPGAQDIINNAGLSDQKVKSLSYPTYLQNICSKDGKEVTLSWNAAQGSPTYSLNVDDTKNKLDTDLWSPQVREQIPASTSTQQVTCDNKYHWWVSVLGDSMNVPSGTFSCSCLPDTESPTIPRNLFASAVTHNSITLSWDPSNDNVSVARYDVYRDGIKIGSANTTTYTDTDLTPHTSYIYTVQAVDSAGNVSSPSDPQTFVTYNVPVPPAVLISLPDPVPPPVVTVDVPASVVLPVPPPSKVLGVQTYRPAVRTVALKKNSWVIKSKAKKKTVQPFGAAYAGALWARRIDFAANQTLYIFANADPTANPAIVLYNAQGKKIGSYQPFGKLATSGLDIITVVDGSGNVFLAVTTQAKNTFVQMYKVAANKLIDAGQLTISASPATLHKKFVSIGGGRVALVTMPNSQIKQQKIWSYDAKSKRFVPNSWVQIRTVRF